MGMNQEKVKSCLSSLQLNQSSTNKITLVINESGLNWELG